MIKIAIEKTNINLMIFFYKNIPDPDVLIRTGVTKD